MTVTSYENKYGGVVKMRDSNIICFLIKGWDKVLISVTSTDMFVYMHHYTRRLNTSGRCLCDIG
jgi:hypothetical protein